MEKCLSCGVEMPLDELQNHVDFCREFLCVAAWLYYITLKSGRDRRIKLMQNSVNTFSNLQWWGYGRYRGWIAYWSKQVWKVMTSLITSLKSSHCPHSFLFFCNVECVKLSSDEEMAGEQGAVGYSFATPPLVTSPIPPRMRSPSPPRAIFRAPTPPSYSPMNSPIGAVEKTAFE